MVKIHVTEGSEVAAGDLLFKLDDSELVAELGEIDARLRLAESVKQRVANLLPHKAISQQEADSSNAAFDILSAERNTNAVQISKTEIRAPFAGRVGVRQVSEGAFVTPTTPLITLQDVPRIKVDFPLPERYSGEVKSGQKFTFTVAGNGKLFEGEVTVLEPAIDVATRSLLVRGLCSAPQGLQPGGFAEVTLTLDGDVARHCPFRAHRLLLSRRAGVSCGRSAGRHDADELPRCESGCDRFANHRAAGTGDQRHRPHPHHHFGFSGKNATRCGCGWIRSSSRSTR